MRPSRVLTWLDLIFLSHNSLLTFVLVSLSWGVLQALPRSVPSLYGTFPESVREELQGFVSEPEWEEGRNRTGFEHGRIAQSPLMEGFSEDDFRWAYSVCLLPGILP